MTKYVTDERFKAPGSVKANLRGAVDFYKQALKDYPAANETPMRQPEVVRLVDALLDRIETLEHRVKLLEARYA